MSADRTLTSVIRTSLSLISFGFTNLQIFQKLREQQIVAHSAPARSFGIALVGLGITMLAIGIVYHLQFMLGLRRERQAMKAAGLIHAESRFPTITHIRYRSNPAVYLRHAIVSMTLQAGPFA